MRKFVVVVAAILALGALSDRALAASGFSPTGSMTTALYQPLTVTLNDGRVLLAGGNQASGSQTAVAQLWSPMTGTFSPTLNVMSTERAGAAGGKLPDGRVLVAGGFSLSGPVASADIFDPETGSFTPTGSMATPRYNAVGAVLPDGKILITGGFNVSGALASAEIYDPEMGTFTPTGAMSTPRGSTTAVTLTGGRVLVLGGFSGGVYLASAEIYDSSLASFVSSGSMSGPRASASAVSLTNGEVLVMGGSGAGGEILASAEIFDPASATFTPTGSMAVPRSTAMAAALPRGRVLVAGGVSPGGYLASAELFNPAAGAFTETGSMSQIRAGAGVATIAGGRVLVAGGRQAGVGILATPVAEIFELKVQELRVNKAGKGKGTVASAPAGIACGGVCVEIFDQDSNVTLTAAPAAGSAFAGWAGACSGNGSCQLNMGGDRQVTATFRPLGKAGLGLTVKPKSKAVRRGKRTVIRAAVRNTSTRSVGKVRVCAKAPARLVEMKRCRLLGKIGAGKSKTARFQVAVKRKARKGSKAVLRFTAKSGSLTGKARATIKVR